MEELNFYHWWQIITGTSAIIASIAVAIISFVQSKHQKTMDSINTNSSDLKKLHNEHSNRITRLEATIKKMPEYHNMETINKEVSGIKGQLIGIEKSLSLINQHLLNNPIPKDCQK